MVAWMLHTKRVGNMLWRVWILGVVFVVVVLLFVGLKYHSETFFRSFIFYFLVVCIRTTIRVLRCCRG
jgi:hypothetical protein